MAIKLKEANVAFLRLISLTLSCVAILMISLLVHINHCIAYVMVALLERITGTQFRNSIKYHEQRQKNIKNVKFEQVDVGIIDSKATFSVANSAGIMKFTPETLITKTRQLLTDVELGSKLSELLADDFQAVFPFMGPLDKETFCNSRIRFNRNEALAPEHDSRSNYFGFTVDPTELDRVWFFARSELVHRGAQVFSMSFDDEGKCYKYTEGYPIDGTSGNCDGLGGLFGILHHIKPGSLPFPEGCPWNSLQWQVWYDRVPQIGGEWNTLLSALSLKRE